MDPHLGPLLYRFRRDWQTAGPFIKRTLLSMIVACLPVLLISSGLTEAFDPLLLRPWFGLRGSRETPKSVSIVRLDKPAYDLVRLSTGEMFPRDKLAEGIEKIAAAGATLIVLDGILQRPGDDPEADQALARALEQAPVVIGRWTEESVNVDPNGRRHTKRTSVRPIPLFAERASAVIPLEVRLINGVVREIALSNERDVLSDVAVPLFEPLKEYISPTLTPPGGFDFINFYGGPHTITSLSMAELLSPEVSVDPAYFKGRVVFIGVLSQAGAGIDAGKDTFTTSVSRKPMYGVEIHATIAANLLDRSWIRRLPVQIESLLMSLVAFAVTFFVLAAGPIAALVIALCGAAAWLGLSFLAFAQFRYFLPGLTLFLFLVPLVLVLRWGAIVLARRQQA